jgi:hypothetical protein
MQLILLINIAVSFVVPGLWIILVPPLHIAKLRSNKAQVRLSEDLKFFDNTKNVRYR